MFAYALEVDKCIIPKQHSWPGSLFRALVAWEKPFLDSIHSVDYKRKGFQGLDQEYMGFSRRDFLV